MPSEFKEGASVAVQELLTCGHGDWEEMAVVGYPKKGEWFFGGLYMDFPRHAELDVQHLYYILKPKGT